MTLVFVPSPGEHHIFSRVRTNRSRIQHDSVLEIVVCTAKTGPLSLSVYCWFARFIVNFITEQKQPTDKFNICDLFCHDFEIYTLALSIRAPVRPQRREPAIVTPCSTRHRFCVLNIEFTVYFWSFVLHFDGKLLTFAACAVVQETLLFDLQWNRPTPFNRRIFKQEESPARERHKETL